MTRLQQARHLAITSEPSRYATADRHRVRDTEPPPRSDPWDSDWAPTPNETGAPPHGRTGGNGTGSRAAETDPAENAYPKEAR